MALRLGRFFGTSDEFWLNLQKLYELRLAERENGVAIARLPTLDAATIGVDRSAGRDLPLRDIRRTDAHALHIGCHDGALLKFRPVTTENSGTHRPLVLRTQVHESYDSSMWTSMQHRQLAEVLVERDQCLSVRGCRRQDSFIPGILGPVADPLDIVTRGAQNSRGAAPHTGVEQNLHEPEDSTSAGSMRSWPTRRRA